MEEKDFDFNNRLSEFQFNKSNPRYVDFEGYVDLKTIFKLYSEVLHYKGYRYNYLSVERIMGLLEGVSLKRKVELLDYLIKCLKIESHESDADELEKELSKLRVRDNFEEVVKGRKVWVNLIKLVSNLSSINLLSLFVALMVVLSLSVLFYSEAYFKSMELIEVNYKDLCSNQLLNKFFNVVMYLLGFDYKMSVKPLNIFGVFLMVFLKGVFYLLIVNYLISKILKKIKI